MSVNSGNMKLYVAVILCCIVCTHGEWNDFWSKNCCEPHDDEHLGRICDDGSRAPLVGCCGIGGCNVMCCNCDGGCKTGRHKPYKLLGVWGADISPNFGISGTGEAAAGAQFASELGKNTALQSGKAGYDIGSAAVKGNKEDDSNIEYHPSRH